MTGLEKLYGTKQKVGRKVSANSQFSMHIHRQLLLRGTPSQPRKPWGGTEGKEVAGLQKYTDPTRMVPSGEDEASKEASRARGISNSRPRLA